MVRREARAAGEKRYSGRPCLKCEATERWTTTGSCVACMRKTVREAATARRVAGGDDFITRRRRTDLMTKYGLSLEAFNAMWAEQGATCKICSDPLVAGKDKHAVDHCHQTGAVRGLLCGRCNKGLGLFLDDPARLAAAAEYLNLHRSTDDQRADT